MREIERERGREGRREREEGGRREGGEELESQELLHSKTGGQETQESHGRCGHPRKDSFLPNGGQIVSSAKVHERAVQGRGAKTSFGDRLVLGDDNGSRPGDLRS